MATYSHTEMFCKGTSTSPSVSRLYTMFLYLNIRKNVSRETLIEESKVLAKWILN